MLHLTTCRRLGKVGEPTRAEIIDMRDRLFHIETKDRKSDKIIGASFIRSELEICIAALRIVSEL